MAPQTETSSARSDARAQRRWLIGLVITVSFGIFGAVMAVLAYKDHPGAPHPHAPTSSTSAPAASPSTEPAPASVPDDQGGKSHGKDHGRNK